MGNICDNTQHHLHDYCKTGDEYRVKQGLKRSLRMRYTRFELAEYMELACENGHHSIVQMLVEYGGALDIWERGLSCAFMNIYEKSVYETYKYNYIIKLLIRNINLNICFDLACAYRSGHYAGKIFNMGMTIMGMTNYTRGLYAICDLWKYYLCSCKFDRKTINMVNRDCMLMAETFMLKGASVCDVVLKFIKNYFVLYKLYNKKDAKIWENLIVTQCPFYYLFRNKMSILPVELFKYLNKFI